MPSDPVTSIPKTTTTTTLRHAWRQTRVYWDQSPRLRGAYLAAYLVFFCGFLFFPSSKSHNNFFYAALLAPSLIMLGHLFSDFWKHRVFRLIMIYVLFLVLTGLWGENVSIANIARQVKHLLYVLAFLTASIVIEFYHKKRVELG